MGKVFDRGQPWRHVQWTLKGREREDVREDFPEGDAWAGFWRGMSWGDRELENLGELYLWRHNRGLQTFAEGSVSRGLRSWGRDHRAPQRTIRQALFRARLSYNCHGQFSRASHLAPMSCFPFLNLKFFLTSKAIHEYGRKWKNRDEQIEENYTTRNLSTKPLLTTYKSFQVFMYVFFFNKKYC